MMVVHDSGGWSVYKARKGGNVSPIRCAAIVCVMMGGKDEQMMPARRQGPVLFSMKKWVLARD